MATTNSTMPSALDRQIDSEEHDAFGHRHYAGALQSIVESEDYQPPFSVGLLGGWGTGKSSIKDIYTSRLTNDELKNSDGLRRSDRFQYITFNAWRFGGTGQDIKRALLRHVFKELGGNDEYIKDQLFREIAETQQKNKGTWEYLKESFLTWGMPLLPITLIIFLLFVGVYLLLGIAGVTHSWGQLVGSLFLTGIVPFLVKNLSLTAVPTTNPINRISLPSTSVEEYEDLLLEQLAKFKRSRRNKKCERIIVFVDDLDRLSAEEMVQGLDAIRTFMEIPDGDLPDGIGLVFVISCDEARIADALAGRHRQDEIPGAIFSQSDARRYLDRIFQFRLEIPPFPRQDMRQYASDRVRALPQLSAYLESEGVPIESVVDRMIHVGVTNPRKALQIVNSFAQSWWIANKRETEELGSGRPGGLHDGAVTSHPITLGAISALKVSFPEFYAHLQDDPALIHRLTDVLVRGKSIDELPASTQELLKDRYFRVNKSEKSSTYQLLQQHRPLRQYLSSLNGLRWPPALDSFLYLSEDPITRAHGSKAREIYNSLISGDTQGVLEGLGKHTDNSTLEEKDARLLHNMIEDLRLETKPRQVASSKVVAELAPRIPSTMSGQLIGQICRTLNDERELRCQLGITRIGEIVRSAVPGDQKAIASRLVDDILVSESEFTFLLETQELPNLDEAQEITKSAIDLILPVRASVGLEDKSDSRLISWLLTREITVKDSSYQIPFDEFEGWIDLYGENLLPDLNDEYADLLAVDLQSSSSQKYDVEKALHRVKSIFEKLYRRGEDSRSILWQLVNRYVALDNPQAAELGWTTAHKSLATAGSSNISGFISAFVGRLEKETQSDSDNWEIDLDSANSTIVSILAEKINEIKKPVRLEVAELCKLWSFNEVNVDTSIAILEILQNANNASAEPIFLDWSNRLLSNLPVPCVEFVASNVSTLSDEALENMRTQLSSVVTATDFDNDRRDSYKAFMENLPTEDRSNSLILQHLREIWPVVASHNANQNSYLYKVFPVLTSFINYTPKDVVGGALHTLFTKAVGHTSHYSYIHSWMTNKWPSADAETGPYNPDTIFSQALQFSLDHPGETRVGLLRSIASMVEKGLVDASRANDVKSAACSVWAVSPEESVRTLTGDYSDLSVEQTTNLTSRFDWGSEENIDRLGEVYEAICAATPSESKVESTKQILSNGPSGPPERPDCALDMWIESLGSELETVLESTILSSDIVDDNRARLWSQISKHDATKTPEFLLQLLPKLLVIPESESTAKSVLGNVTQLKDMMRTSDYHAALARDLMANFSSYPTKTVKSAVARASKELSGEASISHLDANEISATDLEILQSVFSDSRALRKIKKGLSETD
jgi:KAP-like P-loop domain-containing protein